MTISTRFCNFLIASRSCLERLSRITAGCEDMRSCCTAVMNVSRADQFSTTRRSPRPFKLHLTGWLLASVAVFPSLSKNSCRRKRLAKSSMSSCISDQLMRCGLGTKVNPRESSLISASESCTLERFITMSSSCWLEVLCLFERGLRFFLFFRLRGGLAFRCEG